MSNLKVFKMIQLVLACMVCTSITAQLKSLSLKDALILAEKNYPQIKAKQLQVSSAKANILASQMDYLPNIKLHAQIDNATANSLAGTYFPYGVVVPISGAINNTSDPKSYFGSIGLAYLELPLYGFGQIRAKVNISKASYATELGAYENEKFNMYIRVCISYLDFLSYHQLKIVQEKNLDRALTLQKSIIANVRNGLKPGVDSSFAAAEISNAKLQLFELEKKENEQKNILANSIGILNNDFNPDTMSFSNALLKLDTIHSVINHPLVQYFESRIKESQAKEHYIALNYLPKFSLLGADWGRGSGLSPISKSENSTSFNEGTNLTRFNYAIGIACTFTISDIPKNILLKRVEHLKIASEKENLNGIKQELKNEQQLADDNLVLSLKQANEAPNQLKAGTDNYNQKLTMYNNGLASIVDLAQALYNLNRAETAQTIYINAAWKALLFKAESIGDLSIFTKQF